MALDHRHLEAARLRADGLTQAETADAIGVSARTIRRWEHRDLLSAALAATDGADDDADTEPDEPRTDVRRPRVSGRARDGTPSVSLTEARARKEAALAAQHELKLRRLQGELVPLETVEALIRDATQPLDVALRTLSRELGPRWAKRLGVSEGEALALVRELCEALRARLVAAIDANVAKAREVAG